MTQGYKQGTVACFWSCDVFLFVKSVCLSATKSHKINGVLLLVQILDLTSFFYTQLFFKVMHRNSWNSNEQSQISSFHSFFHFSLLLQVFCHLAGQHLDEINSWSSDPPLIQIGGGGFNGFSQSTFLNNYANNWELEQKEKKKKKKLQKKVNFVNQSYVPCDTKAFFLTPLKMKNVIPKEKLDLKRVCQLL